MDAGSQRRAAPPSEHLVAPSLRGSTHTLQPAWRTGGRLHQSGCGGGRNKVTPEFSGLCRPAPTAPLPQERSSVLVSFVRTSREGGSGLPPGRGDTRLWFPGQACTLPGRLRVRALGTAMHSLVCGFSALLRASVVWVSRSHHQSRPPAPCSRSSITTHAEARLESFPM